MTGNEIIKALEEAIDKAEANGSIEEFVLTLSRGTVEDIIKAYNRQKAEIERLQEMLDSAVSSERNAVESVLERQIEKVEKENQNETV